MQRQKSRMHRPGESLKDRMRLISFLAVSVVVLSIAGSLAVSGFGLLGFNGILQNSGKSLELWKAVDEEKRAFAAYIQGRTQEQETVYQEAARRTEHAVENLPYDYRDIGARRYAQTWSIQNIYETYVIMRTQVLQNTDRGGGYMDTLYSVYRIQDYLQDYAGRLQQMNVEEGNQRYEVLRPLFAVIPAAAVFFGIAAVAAVERLKGWTSKRLVEPVLRLAEDSGRIAANDFDGPEMEALGDDEIARLIRSFYHMKRSTKGYITALKEKHQVEKELDAVRLQMLKNQINPHFLFNTLNMIASMAQVEEAAVTEQMITALSRLFRYNLKSTDSVMPLERELKVVQDYMYLQQMRFGKRLRYTMDCAPDTLEVLVPSFALQPLVENAVIHGISGQKKGGKVHICARNRLGRLYIYVSDTGCGIEENRLQEIRKALAEGDTKRTGIGVGNIYRRIHSMYQDGEMELYSCPGKGTVIRLSFSPGVSEANDNESGGQL